MKKINTLNVSFVIAVLALAVKLSPACAQGLQTQARELERSILKQRKARKTASMAHKYLYELCEQNYDMGRYDEARNYAKKILAMDPGAEDAKNWLLRIETAQASLEDIALSETESQYFWEEVVIEEEAADWPKEQALETAAAEKEILEEPQPLEEKAAPAEKAGKEQEVVEDKREERETTAAEKSLEKEIAAIEKVIEKEIAEIKEILEEKLEKEKKEIEEVEVEIEEFAKKETERKQQQAQLQARPRTMKLERGEALKYHYNLAIAYEEKGQYDEAEAEYKKALEAVPDDPDTHYNLGVLYDDRFLDRVSAVKHYKKYLELKPSAQDKEQVRTWIRWAQQQIAIGKF